MSVLTDWCGMTVALTVAATSGFVSGVGDLDLPPAGEEEDVHAHLFTLLRGGSDHHRGGVFEGASIRVRVEEASRGNLKVFCIEDGGFEVDEQSFRVGREVTEG